MWYTKRADERKRGKYRANGERVTRSRRTEEASIDSTRVRGTRVRKGAGEERAESVARAPEKAFEKTQKST